MATPELIDEVNRTLAIYEDVTGRRAQGARDMISRRGYIGALSKLMESSDFQKGFCTLRDRGELHNTFEAVILRFPSEFTQFVREGAQFRIDHPNG